METTAALREIQKEEVPEAADVTVRVAVYVTADQHAALESLGRKLANIDRLTSASGLVRQALDYGLPLLNEEIDGIVSQRSKRGTTP